ncbi:serine-type D-Ala-D-Ala carboxypeptidase [Vibrio viridaestus]|uniref:Serine-type D-Ala-D-Ala carboxypeptidase n=1 Tax=Vibrio viridaestus TaxID=2487322 RepID=A0A3N9TI27_9VIBR|nr:serine-type D-Ala-D-Ala carboxypeptidase [Vibrio viridaestus]RQW63849.1 serine-type D-Ala-D-Ala carboxypeptidase [Vibrio viridaestus]
MRLFLLLFISVFSWSAALAQETNPSGLLPTTTRSGLLIESLSGKEYFAENANKLFPPASTTKLLTALAAKLELGDQFKFTTTVAKNKSDIIIHFSGDPNLTNIDLETLLTSVISQEGKKIKGNIWLDNSSFSGYQKAVGWPWDILGVCYSAPSSAITLDRNCVYGSIYTQKNGATRVYTPDQFPIVVTSKAKTVSSQERKQELCDLELTSNDENHYLLEGCLTARKEPLPLKFAIQNPDLYTTRMVYKILNKLDVSLSGQVIAGIPPKYKTKEVILAEHHSAQLPELLDRMLKKSDNLIANNITKALGKHFFIQPGTFTNGTEAIKQVLFSKAQIDLNSAQLFDGSGLSRNNRLTARQLASVLKYIQQNDTQLQLLQHLPIAGQSGTLKYRSSMRNQDVTGKIKAKSGSLYGSYNMAGYGLDKDGKPKNIFVQLVTDYFPNEEEKRQRMMPLIKFETAFYKEVIGKK